MKLIILDRDGVINEDSKDFIKSPDEWRPLKGSLEAIGRLAQAGFHIVIITNQSGIGRKLFSADMLGQIHVRMLDYVQQHGGTIESIMFCPHHPDDGCECRKPKAGMYHSLAKRLNTNFDGVYSIGDSIRDLQAAHTAGALPVLVKTGNGKKSLRAIEQGLHPELNECGQFDNLAKFVDALLSDQLNASKPK